MDLLIISEKVKDSKRKYIDRYELYSDRDNSLFRKNQLLSLDFVRRVDIIPIELSRILRYENIQD